MLLDPQACLTWVQDISGAYVNFHRPDYKAEEIVDLKLSVNFWRSRLLDRLLSNRPSWMAEQQETTVQIFRALRIILSEQQLRILAHILDPPFLARLKAAQGLSTPDFPEYDTESGPGVELNIVANRGSSTSYEKWRKNELFSRYRFEGDGAHYRGVFYRPGDVLLANANLDGNGVYTCLSEPVGFCSHSAFFAILEHDGKRFPVVIETYEKGVRPVPLSVFLGRKFCSYVEVYRHLDISEESASKFNLAAAKMINEVLGYNFATEDQDPYYLACTTVGRFLHRSAGLKPAENIGRFGHPQVQANLSSLGYHWLVYFGPVDYLLNQCFKCIGFTDNNQPERMLAREITDREFKRQFMAYELDGNKFPFPSKINRWGLGHMRRKTVAGRLISRLEGFTAETLPKGPDHLVAAIVPIEKQLGKLVVKTRGTVEKVLVGMDQLDMAKLAADPRIVESLRQNFKLPWLQNPGTALETTVADEVIVQTT